MVETLNGTGDFAFVDGAIHGVNIVETIRSLGEMGSGEDGPPQKTDFVEISGTVGTVCVKKGCWLGLTGTKPAVHARVTFKDYAFFMPTEFHRLVE